MRHEYTSGLVDIHLLPGLTGYVNVTFNDGIYNCLYTRGLLDGT